MMKNSLQHGIDMLVKAYVIIGCLSIAKGDIKFCFEDLCFIRPDYTIGKTWTVAQKICKANNSTLPIVDNPGHQRSFAAALNHFNLTSFEVWLGAKGSPSDNDPSNWRWLNGSKYNGPDIQQQGEYGRDYALVSYQSTRVLVYAATPLYNYSYICEYSSTIPSCSNGTGRMAFVKANRCYVRYNNFQTWFSARNNCLSNCGDLASFAQLSLLDGIANTGWFWVGLRDKQWNWQNAVTGTSSEVTFTSWRTNQPIGSPECIATDRIEFPNWKGFDCTAGYSYFCQVN